MCRRSQSSWRLAVLHVVVLMAVAGGGLVGCRKRAPPPDKTRGDALRVAILLPGAHDDHEWGQAGFEGLMLIEKELGAEVAYSENVREADAAALFRRYADEGYQFIIGHGAEYVPAAEIVAVAFPQTKFAVVATYPGNNRNLGALRFEEGELGFLTGAVAALKTQTRKVAYIGGMPYPHLREQATLFERGAKYIDPSVEVAVVWLDTWTDEARARQAARSHIGRGFDVLSVNADKVGLSVIEEAKHAGVWAIGWNLDQYELAPGTIITSGVQRVPVLLLGGARLVKLLRFEGKQYRFGLRDNAQDLAPLRGSLPAEKAAVVERIRSDIIQGRIDVSP